MTQLEYNLLENKAGQVNEQDIGDFKRKLNGFLDKGKKTLLNRLVVVSNRLPVTIRKDGDGELQVKPSSGGLVTALSPVMRNTEGLWIGWPGSTATYLDGHLTSAGSQLGCTFEKVVLSEKEFNDYYLGFCNQILWPLFHDQPQFCRIDFGYWQSYSEVNRKFAQTVAQISKSDDYIWVQDYHLLLLAMKLRSIGVKRQTGFFLHTPFPSPEIFELLPWRNQILEALLDYDLLGFQAQRDRDNFIQCIEQTVGGLSYEYRDRLIVVDSDNDKTAIGVFPISIDASEFEMLAMSDTVKSRVKRIRHDKDNCQIILGVDRLDYSKGIPLRLQAYRSLLERFKSIHGKIAMVQIVVPSRDCILEYQNVKSEIENLVDDINNRFSTGGWVPVQYMYQGLDRSELVAYYRASDIALVTPIMDGMNLIAKEYCAANVDNNGILILSEFAGAAVQLEDNALIVNPYDVEEVANSIYHAYCMPAYERTSRMQGLRHSVRRNDIYWWSNRFLQSALKTSNSNGYNKNKFLSGSAVPQV